MSDVTVRGVYKAFGNAQAVQDVSFHVESGSFFTLLGPSGCGKSTTLSILAGLEVADAGQVSFGSKTVTDTARRVSVPPEQREVGMVFQGYALWPHMTVAENVGFPLKLRRVPRRKRRERVTEVCAEVGMDDLLARYPSELSGGQQQRVALARAMAHAPRVLLLDEPLSNLDARLRERSRVWLKDVQRRMDVTYIYVTHDRIEALALSDQIGVLLDGEMAQVGTPRELYDSPNSVEVADFLSECLVLHGVVTKVADPTAHIRLHEHLGEMVVKNESPLVRGQVATIAIRGEDIIIPADATDKSRGEINLFKAEIRDRSFVGNGFDHLLSLGAALVHVQCEERLPGETVCMAIPYDAASVFVED